MKKILIGLVLLVSSCKSNNATLDEAYEIHKEIRELQREVMLDVGRLDTYINDENKEDVMKIKADYIEWKNDILEVPGYPHIHLDGDDHSHSPQPKLGDNEVLEIQKESKKKLDDIESRIKKVKEGA